MARRVALALVLCAVLAGCATVQGLLDGYPVRGPDAPPGTVEIATGTTQGVYHQYGEALVKSVGEHLPGVHARVLTTEGSVENLRLVASGRCAVAFSAADVASDAFTGRGVFGDPQPIRAIGRVYDDYVHLVVRAGSPIRSAADLRGMRVSVGRAGSGTEIIATRVLRTLGMRPDGPDLAATAHLGLGESVRGLRTRRLDAFFWSGGLPTPAVEALARDVEIRLVPLAGLAPAMRRYRWSYRPAVAPAGTYPRVPVVRTLAVPDFLVTRADTDPALVYQLTRLLFASRRELAGSVPIAGGLDPRAAIQTDPVPLHPGALRYYRDTKY